MMPTFGMERLQEIDNRDDSREIYYAFTRLTVNERLSFLRWCCSIVNVRHRIEAGVDLQPRSLTGHPNESFKDFQSLVVHHGLDLRLALPELERRLCEIRLP